MATGLASDRLKSAFRVWLRLQCQMIGKADAAWLVRQADGDPVSESLAMWSDSGLSDDQVRTRLAPALTQVSFKKRLHLEAGPDSPLQLAQPLSVDGKHWGYLLLALPEADKKSLPALLKQLHWGQIWLQFVLHLRDEQLPATSPGATGQGQILAGSTLLDDTDGRLAENGAVDERWLTLCAQLLKEQSLQETCISLVNWLAVQRRSVRVSLGLRNGKRLQIEAVSFSANFDRRTQSMQRVLQAMHEAWDQRSHIRYPAADDAPDSLVRHAHQQLLADQQLARIETVRLVVGDVPVGILVMEFSGDSRADANGGPPLAPLWFLVGHILALKSQAQVGWQRGFRASVTHKLQGWLGRGHLAGKAVLAGLALGAGILCIPVAHKVTGDAVLQSQYRYLVVAPQDGFLGGVTALPGATVAPGDSLGQLRDEDLQLERRKFASLAQQYRQEYDVALANGNRVEAAIASARLDQANSQLDLAQQQLERTRLTAPAAGVVISDDISQRLGAPVKQGEVLFEIAAGEGFQVQLYIDERDIGALAPGQSGSIRLSSLPGEPFLITVESISPINQIREGRNYFRVEARVEQPDAALRPGMTGRGHIEVGRRALGWVWFHDAWDWLRLLLW